MAETIAGLDEQTTPAGSHWTVIDDGSAGAKKISLTNLWAGLTSTQGPDGDSAYDIAVANGFVGTEAEWLTSLIGAQGDTGATGATGATGPAGADGADGVDGADGAVWRAGSGGPDNVVGVDGDFWLDTDNGNVYERVSAAYQLVANIVGPTGPPDGSTVLNGTGAPNVGLGADGDFYIDTAVWAIYGPKATTWGSAVSLIGPTGPQGETGATGDTGVVRDSSPPADLNKLWVDTNTDPPTVKAHNGLPDPDAAWEEVWTVEGPAGQGLAAGGTTGQVLAKVDGTDYNTEWADVVATAADLPIVDAGGYYAATEAEAALQEIAADLASEVAAVKAAAYTKVAHGADSTVARPTGWAGVIWVGTVQPDNISGDDFVIRTDEAV